MGRREGYAKPVAIASFSMDPELINWLNDYATKLWKCPACEQATANSDTDTACWRCKEPKP